MEYAASIRHIFSTLPAITAGLGLLLVMCTAGPNVQQPLSAAGLPYADADTTLPDSMQVAEQHAPGLIIRSAERRGESPGGNTAAPERRRLQEKAVHALSQLPAEQAVSRLVQIAETHPHLQIRRMAVVMLGRQHDEHAADALAAIALSDAAPEMRKAALQGLGRSGSPQAETVLIRVVRTAEHASLRETAIHWLGRIGGERAADVLMEIAGGS